MVDSVLRGHLKRGHLHITMAREAEFLLSVQSSPVWIVRGACRPRWLLTSETKRPTPGCLPEAD
jgi:hypothetical protein